jgi:hypothetical protein
LCFNFAFRIDLENQEGFISNGTNNLLLHSGKINLVDERRANKLLEASKNVDLKIKAEKSICL